MLHMCTGITCLGHGQVCVVDEGTERPYCGCPKNEVLTWIGCIHSECSSYSDKCGDVQVCDSDGRNCSGHVHVGMTLLHDRLHGLGFDTIASCTFESQGAFSFDCTFRQEWIHPTV
jgi:hypothetical protein